MNEKDIAYDYEKDLKLIMKLYIKALEDIKKRLYV